MGTSVASPGPCRLVGVRGTLARFLLCSCWDLWSLAALDSGALHEFLARQQVIQVLSSGFIRRPGRKRGSHSE